MTESCFLRRGTKTNSTVAQVAAGASTSAAIAGIHAFTPPRGAAGAAAVAAAGAVASAFAPAAGAAAGAAGVSVFAAIGLAFKVDDILEDRVRNSDQAGTRLETTLSRDQAGELLRKIDVRELKRAGLDQAKTVCAGAVV